MPLNHDEVKELKVLYLNYERSGDNNYRRGKKKEALEFYTIASTISNMIREYAKILSEKEDEKIYHDVIRLLEKRARI
jgi:hypothetical protein